MPINNISIYITSHERKTFDQASAQQGLCLSRWIKEQILRDNYLDCSFNLHHCDERFEMLINPEEKAKLKQLADSYKLSMTEYVRYRCWEGVEATYATDD